MRSDHSFGGGGREGAQSEVGSPSGTSIPPFICVRSQHLDLLGDTSLIIIIPLPVWDNQKRWPHHWIFSCRGNVPVGKSIAGPMSG